MKFDFLRRDRAKAPEHKASATGALVTFRGGGRAVWSPRPHNSRAAPHSVQGC